MQSSPNIANARTAIRRDGTATWKNYSAARPKRRRRSGSALENLATTPPCPTRTRRISCAVRRLDSLSARALEFTILTAARTAEVIGAKWSEFDLKERTWTVPAGRMKMRKEHNVPLCDRAVAILEKLPRHGDRVFNLSDMAMLQCLRGLWPGLTVHGFRSTFMDWAHEQTASPKVVIDMALAHSNR